MRPDRVLPPDTAAAIDRLEPADVVIGTTACTTPDAIALAAEAAVAAFARSTPRPRAVLVHPAPPVLNGEPDGRAHDPHVQLLSCPLPAIGRFPFAASDGANLFHPLSVVASRVGARACGLTGTRPEGITPQLLSLLVSPTLDQSIDLVLPHYARHPLDGLINSAIVYPFTRALYGLQVDGQLGVDFGFSPRLLAALASPYVNRGSERPIWLLTEAAERSMSVGQALVGTWLPPLESPTDVSTALAQVLGSLFEDTEHHAAVWQHGRGSRPVPTFGAPDAMPDEPRTIDTRGMIDSFKIGLRNLQEVWGRVLPPATLIELSRLTRLPEPQFRMPDTLWARLIFDVALGHRTRVISRDHLLRAMTPLYLAWVASFVLEMGDTSSRSYLTVLERLCRAFETEKPYLLARWRWPDRFNP